MSSQNQEIVEALQALLDSPLHQIQEVLRERQATLLSNTAITLLGEYIAQLSNIGNTKEVVELERFLRLLKRARDEGIDKAVAAQLEELASEGRLQSLPLPASDIPQESAQAALALASARNEQQLAQAFADHWEALKKPETAVILRRMAEGFRQQGIPDEAAAHFEIFAIVLDEIRRSALSMSENGQLETEMSAPEASRTGTGHYLPQVLLHLLAWIRTPNRLASPMYLDTDSELHSREVSQMNFQLLTGAETSRDDGAIRALITYCKELRAIRASREILSSKARSLIMETDALALSHNLSKQIPLLEETLTYVSYADCPTIWVKLNIHLGYALVNSEQGDMLSQTKQALACFDAALSGFRREEDPFLWAAVQSYKGDALYSQVELSEEKDQVARLPEVLALYDLALPYSRQVVVPDEWAFTQHNKGAALLFWARQLGGNERLPKLQEAIACFDAALQIWQQTTVPDDWAQAQFNKGNALLFLFSLLEDKVRAAKLQEAIACFDAALQVWQQTTAPNNWARTQERKGGALLSLQELLLPEERTIKYQEAIACFDAALQVWQQTTAPNDWARTQQNKGSALVNFSSRLEDEARAANLQEAITCFDEALQVWSQKGTGSWLIQIQKAQAQLALARLLEAKWQANIFFEALASLEDVLSEIDLKEQQNVPAGDAVIWALAQLNKGDALVALAHVTEEESRAAYLRGAIACYDAGLRVFHHVYPISWAMYLANKGDTLVTLARLLAGKEQSACYDEAISSYKAALTILTREARLHDYVHISFVLGKVFFQIEQWTQAVHYLTAALEGFDDLFTLLVTAYGRQEELLIGGDIAAHLAYALARTGNTGVTYRAAEVLELSRARALGETMARQQAQIQVAEQIAPELLKEFRQVSNRLATIVMTGFGSSTATQASSTLPEVSSQLSSVPLQTRDWRTEYEEARAVRQTYNDVIARIRQVVPDFLQQSSGMESAIKALRTDERIAYVATTPAGSVALLLGAQSEEGSAFTGRFWWDEHLTQKLVEQLLGHGKTLEPGVSQIEGLLEAQEQGNLLRLSNALQKAMHALGIPEGVLARLGKSCREDKIQRLVVIPCGLSGLLPLHAALVPGSTTGTTEPLGDIVRLCYAPNARIWLTCRERTRANPVSAPQVLVVGNPLPQPRAFPLHGAAAEARQVADLVKKKDQGHIYLFQAQEATYQAVLAALQTHGPVLTHIHFACHGVADLQNPQSSALLLAHEERLEVRDILDPAKTHFESLRLVVLSACQTGLPGVELPDEVLGLPAGWLQAGVTGIVASFWPVSDAGTVALMTKFYELHLLDGLDPIEALWLAQRWLRGLPTWRSDAQKAGATQGAIGPEAAEVIGELALRHILVEEDTGSPASDEVVPAWNNAIIWAAFAFFGA